MTLPAARLIAVTHRYGDHDALLDFSLEVRSRSLTGIIGPDGVGKSTLLGLISGMRKIQSGTVEVLGGNMAVGRHRRLASERIAFMPQGLGGNLYGDLSIAENIGFFARLFGVPAGRGRARTRELLDTTGLAPYADRRVAKLSGGMKQKLGLCCALIHEPELLILDEPTTGVDPLSRRNFWDLVRRMRAHLENLTVLVATAYMEEAEHFDRLIMLDGGKLLAEGSPADLRAATSATSLEAAYVSLLPETRRQNARPLDLTPRSFTNSENAIETSDLTRRFGDFTAVDRVNIRIAKGEIFGFLGPNGCGKSTTMKMLTGLLPATSGDATLFGQSVASGGIELRRRVGYMAQSFSLYGELTPDENFALHGRLFDLDRATLAARTEELVARFDLGRFRHRAAGSLPLGIRQRLSLAVATLHSPDVLILDEPTSGVDPLARDDFWRLILEMARNEDVTIFVSTHYLNEAIRCDRVALMNAGRLLASAPPAEIAAMAGGDFEQAFVDLIAEDERRRDLGAAA